MPIPTHEELDTFIAKQQYQDDLDNFITRLYKGLWKTIPKNLLPLPVDVERRNNEYA